MNTWDKLATFLRTAPTKNHSVACWLLGHYAGRKKDAPVFLQLLAHKKSDADLMMQAAVELSLVTNAGTMDPLIYLMKSGDTPDRRKAAAYALTFSFFRNVKRLNDAFVEVLNDTEQPPPVRAQAAEGLGNYHAYGDHRTKQFQLALHVLVDALSDRSAEVRFWSAFALGSMGSKAALPALRTLARNDPSLVKGWWYVSEEADDAISNILGREIPDRIPVSLRKKSDRRRPCQDRPEHLR